MAEEAAIIAAEFISTLDNVPSEVAHLLSEIKTKDERILDLQTKLHSRAQRHRQGTLPANKEQNILQKCTTDLDKIDKLSEEKVALAERLVHTLHKACGRLEQDFARVRTAIGQPVNGDTGGVVAAGHGYTAGPRPQIDKVVDTLRAAVATPDPTPQITIPPSTPTPNPPKRRRVNSTQAGHTNNAPVTLTHAHQHVPRAHSRLSTQIHPPSPASGDEEDADGEEDVEEDGGGDHEDQELYCHCQKLSYGEMIACDNAGCPFEWFHLTCVGLKPPLPKTWYCSDCAPKFVSGEDATERTRKRRR
jgi:chromatin modification-related protein YNG2